MKKHSIWFLTCAFYWVFTMTVIVATAQQKSKTQSGKIPPDYKKQIENMLPPGVKLPPGFEMEQALKDGSETDEETANMNGGMLPFFTGPYQAEPGGKVGNFPYNSGRNEAQRAAALAAVLAELNSKPFLLPLPETAPTMGYMLQMTKAQHDIAKKKFSPQELTDYYGMVDWRPEFDSTNKEVTKAREFSVLVASATNFSNRPYLMIALATAVYALDPKSSVAASNFASAFVTAGEHLIKPPLTKTALVPFQKDAESAYLYAIYASRKDGKWTEESIIPAINMGNLCMDLKKYEEARSLFMVARKLKPSSWDAALGLAAYFYALKQPDKALAILEDDNLDRPAQMMMAVKSAKSLQKTDKYVELTADSPEEVFKEGIDIIKEEPILTSADFLENFDQSERNKMRYFIENLPEAGSFTVPSITLVSQYSTLKAISSPLGASALQEFQEKIGTYTLKSTAANAKQQAAYLERLGLKIEGIDFDDLMKHPEKYADGKLGDKMRVTGKEEILANVEKLRKEGMAAQKDLMAGKTNSSVELVGKIDPYFKLLLINPEDYADPYNIIIQKHNFTVYNRKTNLYNQYLRAINKKTTRAIQDRIVQTNKEFISIQKRDSLALDRYNKEVEQARKNNIDVSTYAWKMKLHNIHLNFFNEKNNLFERTFGDITNLASATYVQKIKPNAEGYYLDVIRHIALISDPEVRLEKEMLLKSNVNSMVAHGLYNVASAFSAYEYSDNWDCSCDLEGLEALREKEQNEREDVEEAKRQENLAGKKAFETRNLNGTQLFKKLDEFYDEYDFILFKVRASCAQTVVTLDTRKFPIPPSKASHAAATLQWNEFNSDIKVNGSIGTGISKGPLKAMLDMKGDLLLNGDNLSVKDWSVTPQAKVEATVGNTAVSAVAEATFNQTGLKDYTLTGNIKTSVQYGNMNVTGGASVSYNSNTGLSTDFSATGKYDLKNEFGGEANAEFDASTKRGCSFSGKVEQGLQPVQDFIKETGMEEHAKNAGVELPLDSITQKEFWTGKFEPKKKKGTEGK